jgi:phage major head subunit gpT-like protein
MIAENWATLLEPGLRSVFMTQRDAIIAPSPMDLFYNVVTSNRAFEETFGVGGLGDVPQFNGSIEYDAMEGLYKTTFTHIEWAKGIQVERKLVDDDQYNVINQRATALGLSFGRTREKNAASTFNNAFTSVGSDGVALCGSHPFSPTNSATQSNAGTSALTYDNLIATRKLMREFKDDRGELITVMPNILLVPPELEDTAQTILNSINKPGTNNNDTNIVRGQGYQLVVWDYLTDANNWYLIDGAMAKMHLWWFTRVPVEFALDPKSEFDLVARYRGYERYSFGFDDWRWIYGHSVP